MDLYRDMYYDSSQELVLIADESMNTCRSDAASDWISKWNLVVATFEFIKSNALLLTLRSHTPQGAF
jgi:hypothetical protein